MGADEFREIGCNPDGSVMLRVRVLSALARAMAIQFKVGGLPYGASYARAINHEPLRAGRLRPVGSGAAATTTETKIGPESGVWRVAIDELSRIQMQCKGDRYRSRRVWPLPAGRWSRWKPVERR